MGAGSREQAGGIAIPRKSLSQENLTAFLPWSTAMQTICAKVSSIKTRMALRRPLSNHHRAYFSKNIKNNVFAQRKMDINRKPMTASGDVRKKGSCHMKSSSHAQRCLNGFLTELSRGNRPILCILLHSTRVLQTMSLFLTFSICEIYCTLSRNA